MEPVVVTISHSLGKEEVLRRLRPALGQATQSFPVLKVEEETWSGDRMDFRVRALGQSVSGNVVVGETDVRLEVSLPWRWQSSLSNANAFQVNSPLHHTPMGPAWSA